MRRCPTIVFAVLMCLMSLNGCGYATRGLYPDHIHTVSVPIFQNKGLRRDFEYQLTDKVIHAIETQTPYKVVKSGADSELRGTVESLYKSPYGEDGYDNPRGGVMNVVMSISWVDNTTGKVLGESSQTFNLDNRASYAIDLGQSQATAVDKVFDELADHIVSMMQAPW